MSKKEIDRVLIVQRLLSGEFGLVRAAGLLGISTRQMKRLKRRFLKDGAEGLIHGNRNRQSPRRRDPEQVTRIVNLCRTEFKGFGPTHAVEMLEERHCIRISKEALRRLLMANDLHSVRRRRKAHRERRCRKEHFGELVQIDGSEHDWFEGRRGRCVLMNMVDDATGISLAMLFEGETSSAVMTIVWAWTLLYGIPEALYCDHKNTYVNDTVPTMEQQLSGKTPTNDFIEACKELGIQIIPASTPQAKGRVERNHAVYQDRFVKELRLHGISTIEEANRFLRETFIPKLNKRFAIAAKSPDDRHVALMGKDLASVFCVRSERSVSNDYVIRYKNRFFQITRASKVRPQPGKRVFLKEWLDGSIHVETTKGQLVEIEDITEKLKGGSVSYPVPA